MSLLVTGTVGIDTVETPYGTAEDVLGGSATYFAFAASLITPVRLVAVVGDDFPNEFRAVFDGRPIDTSGLEIRQGSQTFRWHGKYQGDMNSAQTLRTDLNVLTEEAPRIPDHFRDSEYIFLANTHPTIQRRFIDALSRPKLIVCDTMNLWIDQCRDELLKTFASVDGVVMNDGEVRMLTGTDNLIAAGRAVLETGPKFVVVKKGEHGAMLFTADETFVLPAFTTPLVKDPTGAGDSFAAGLMAYLAGNDRTDVAALKSGLAVGICMASITIEDFSLNALRAADRSVIERRLNKLRAMLAFE